MTNAEAPCILVVEDEPRTADLLGHIFEVDGYRVLHANDGARALELAKRKPRVDALLVDREWIDDLRKCEETKDLCIIAVERQMSLDRLREVLHRVHECAPFPPESRSATAQSA
jgi:CheY-like chemotaxis protein